MMPRLPSGTKRRKPVVGSRFAYALLVLTTVLTLPGCGSETRIEKLAAEREALLEKLEEDANRTGPAFERAEELFATAFKLRQRSKRAYAHGNGRTGRELGAAADTAKMRASHLSELALNPGLGLSRRLEAIEKKLRTLDGCNLRCQAREERNTESEFRCVERLIRETDMRRNRADEICSQRFFNGELLGE
jgi:hypothetical protein